MHRCCHPRDLSKTVPAKSCAGTFPHQYSLHLPAPVTTPVKGWVSLRMSRTTALLVCSTVVTATAAGCSGATKSQSGGGGAHAYTVTPNSPAAKGSLDSLTWSLYAEPYTLDYALAYDYPPNSVLANVCEQLLRITPDMKIEPGLAVKYTNPDPKTWVYTLRPGVKFHDGSTMTADDVVASLERHMDPATGSRGARPSRTSPPSRGAARWR